MTDEEAAAVADKIFAIYNRLLYERAPDALM
jgi:hypothetical protein